MSALAVDLAMMSMALFYASLGWPVFPLVPGQKTPATAHGLKDATTDLERIERFLGWRNGTHGIGCATGIAFDALDIDDPGACDRLDEAGWSADDERPIVGPMQRTAKGLHILVKATGEGNRVGRTFIEGVDYRGRGGYIVMAPSLHPSGVRYEWSELGPETPLEDLRPWLLSRLRRERGGADRPAVPRGDDREGGRSRYAQTALDAELGKLLRAVNGTRNHVLNTAALALGQLVAGGELDDATVAAELYDAATRIGLPHDEVVATIRSGMAAGYRSPRTCKR